MNIFGIINLVIALYVIPVIIAYFSAKFYFTYPDTETERAGLASILAIFCPGANIIYALVSFMSGIHNYNQREKRTPKNTRTVGERFLKIKKER